jgi:hypothetical protein
MRTSAPSIVTSSRPTANEVLRFVRVKPKPIARKRQRPMTVAEAMLVRHRVYRLRRRWRRSRAGAWGRRRARRRLFTLCLGTSWWCWRRLRLRRLNSTVCCSLGLLLVDQESKQPQQNQQTKEQRPRLWATRIRRLRVACWGLSHRESQKSGLPIASVALPRLRFRFRRRSAISTERRPDVVGFLEPSSSAAAHESLI